MKLLRNNPRLLKGMSLFLVLTIFGEIFYPTYASALTSGPASPEFSSFEPVSTTSMVDPFTGDFTYNLPVVSIPGADGGGYAMSLSYHSGVTPEEEASWVGFGWTLNAGAINRGKVGYPDEFDNVSVTKYNKIVPSWTVSTVQDLGLEIISSDAQATTKNRKQEAAKAAKVGKSVFHESALSDNSFSALAAGSSNIPSFNYSKSIRYNNYTGLVKSHGFSSNFKGMGSVRMNFTGGNATFGFSVNPLAILTDFVRKRMIKLKENLEKDGANDTKKLDRTYKLLRASKNLQRSGFFNPNFSSRASFQYPGLSVSRTQGKSYNFSASVSGEVWAIGLEVGYSGNAHIVVNEPATVLKANGYMNHLGYDELTTNEKNSDIITDHFIENETAFKKTDKNLGIPFGGADAFAISGEGMGGGFRVHHTKIPHYYPTKVTNKEVIKNIGLEFGYGQTIAVGLDVGLGFHRMQVDNWTEGKRDVLGQDIYKKQGNVPFFQFMNDPAKSLRYTESNAVLSMKLESGKKLNDEDFLDGGGDYYSALSTGTTPNNTIARESSSFIEYRLNSQGRLDKLSESIDINTYTEATNYIREVKVTKPNGAKYIYGVPVFAGGEKNLSVGLMQTSTIPKRDYNSPERTALQEIEPLTVENDYVFSGDNILKNAIVSGESIDEPYATSYLLTQIVSPDYIDVNDNGPDERDFGGWTKFTYRKKYELGNDTYRHRAPYTGIYYNKGRLTNNYDQTGQFSTGQKEVAYMKTVETKTHIACFVTNSSVPSDYSDLQTQLLNAGVSQAQINKYLMGSGVDRLDGRDAKDPDPTTGKDLAAAGEKGNRTLDRLEKIVLFSKSRLSTPLSITHFEYSYELVRGTPNNVNTVDASGVNPTPQPINSGRLTLKKVWTDTEGLVKAKIAPYRFEYDYKESGTYSQRILNKYGSFLDDYDILDDNPEYKLGYLDSWGNYQDLGVSETQRKHYRSWNYQGELPDDYDPAAWALKRIILPSGGEIQVQYEQKDYAYVQDKIATTMVSIMNTSANENGYKHDENKYYINLPDVGIDPTNAASVKKYFVRLAQQYFSNVSFGQVSSSNFEIHDGTANRTKNNMMRFKFLVNYTDNVTNLGVGKSDDYVEGYCPVNKIGIENNEKIYFSLGGEKKVQKYLTPRRIAFEQAKSMGNLALDVNNHLSLATDIDGKLIEKAYDGISSVDANNDYDFGIAIKEVKKYLLKNPNSSGSNGDEQKLRSKMEKANVLVKVPPKSSLCEYFNPEKSHFKLVVPSSKRGGGIRVKRLLMYNPGIEAGEESLYGSEYIYKTKDGGTSGVATNEPGEARIENALVDILPKYKQGAVNKLLAGADKSWAEGPLGEHLLPGPSVGHSRVVVKNIHSGKSNAGFVISEYLTCKEFPSVKVSQTDLKTVKPSGNASLDKSHYKKTKFQIPLGLFNYVQDKAWLTQGYLFEVDDRHGMMKSSYTYNGNYEDYLSNPSNATIYASITNTYSNQAQDVISGSVINGDLVLKRKAARLGEEEDIAMYASQVEDRTWDFSIELDLNFFFMLPPVFSFGAVPSISYNETELNQHITSRVLHRTTKLVESTSYADGIRTTTKNLAYSDLNGSVIVSKVSSAYDSPETGNYRQLSQVVDENVYYSLNLPAPWVYGTMGKKANNSSNLNLLGATMGSISTHNENPLLQFDGDNEWHPYSEPLTNVVSASAVEFRKNRFDDQIADFAQGNTISSDMTFIKEEFGMTGVDFDNVDLAQMNAFYYPVTSYAFIGDRSSANGPNGKVYDAGKYLNFQFFNWKYSGIGQNINGQDDLSIVNTSWQSPSYVTKFSPNGQPLEEVNLLGIPSTVHFGYNHLLPTISGANAEYSTLVFEDYEISSSILLYSNKAHTGKKSINYASTQNGVLSNRELQLTERLEAKGGRFKVWVRLTDQQAADPLYTDVMNVNPVLEINGNEYPLKQIAKVGEWALLRVDVNDWGTMNIDDSFVLSLTTNSLGGMELLIDDVCFHPLEAGVSMTVYDPKDFRVVAQIGDQHFATIYEYSAEGALVRTIIESERGRKTVKEQQGNVPRVNRN